MIVTATPSTHWSEVRTPEMNYPDIIMVILTSYDLPEYRQAARESMADYFVPKGSSVQDFQRNTQKTGPGWFGR